MGSTPGGGPCQNSCGPPLPDTSKRSVAVRFEVFVRSRRPRTRRRWTAATSTGCVVAAAGALVLVHPQQEQQPASAPELSLMNAHQLVSDEVADVASGDQPVADSTHIRRELLQLAVMNAQAMVTDNGVAALTGVGREVGTCVAQWSLATLGAPNADAQALAQCLSPLANLDPSETTEAMRALHFSDIVATLTAAGTPHSPTIVHTLASSFAPAPAPALASPTHAGQLSATAPATPELTPPPPSTTTTQAIESTASIGSTPPVPSAAPATPSAPVPSTTPPLPPDTSSPPAPIETPTEISTVGRQYVAPTSGTITSPFGDGRNHQGIDIANSTGTPIVAVADGVVISSGPAQGFGLWVRIQHNDGTITTYGHNNENTVTVGQFVTAGQEIATVGNRGQSTGPHLHFEVQDPSGQNVDPVAWLAEREASIL